MTFFAIHAILHLFFLTLLPALEQTQEDKIKLIIPRYIMQHEKPRDLNPGNDGSVKKTDMCKRVFQTYMHTCVTNMFYLVCCNGHFSILTF